MLTNRSVINIMLIRERKIISFIDNLVIIKILKRDFILIFVINKILIRKERYYEEERRIRKIISSS